MSVVLVTGAGGFIGGHICDQMLKRNWTIRGLDRSNHTIRSGVKPVIASITDRDAVRSAMEGVDALIHCAAIADLWTRDPSDYEAVNVDGTKIVLEAARDAGVERAVHVSSYVTLIAGSHREPAKPLTEDVTFVPELLLGPYPASKRRSELAAEEIAAQGFAVAIVMPSAPIGAGDVNMTPPARMVRDIATGRLPAYLDCLINLVDVRSVAEGVIAALERGAPGRRYLLTGEDVEMFDLVRRVAALADVNPPTVKAPAAVALAASRVEAAVSKVSGRRPTAPLTGVRLALRRRRFDAARARSELGYTPAPLEDALREAVNWMRLTSAIPVGTSKRHRSA